MRNAQELLTHYAAYHRDRRNIATHFVGIPLIVFGIGVLLSRPSLGAGALALTPAWLAFVAATAWYLRRRMLVLGIATSAFVGLLVLAGHQVGTVGVGGWLVWGVGSFLLGWVLQFIGHYYEGRKPAFVDDVVGLLVGPMFIVAEWLFMAGWNKPLQRAIESQVGPTHLRDIAHPA